MGAPRPVRVPREESSSPKGERLPSASRIRGSEEIRALFRRGKRRRTSHLDVFLAASPVSRPRVGVVVGKHGHGSVERNRMKRWLKELARRRVLPLLWESGTFLDVLVRARPEAYVTSFAELEQQIDGVMEEVCSGRP